MRASVTFGILSIILVVSLVLTPVAGLSGIAYAGSPPSEAPVHLSPPDDATGLSLTPTFEWDEVPEATEYALYISEPPYGPAHLVFDSREDYEPDHGPITGTSFKLPGGYLEQDVKYAWNMQAGNADGWGPYSSSWFFTTGTFGTIVGQITDIVTGQGISGHLYISPDVASEDLLTGPQGHFSFDVPAGKYRITGAACGYIIGWEDDVTVVAGESTALTFALVPFVDELFTITTKLDPPVLKPGDQGELTITVLPKSDWWNLTRENIVTLNPPSVGSIEVGVPRGEVTVGRDHWKPERPYVWWDYGDYQRWLQSFKSLGYLDKAMFVRKPSIIKGLLIALEFYVDDYNYFFNREYQGHAVPAHFKAANTGPAIIYTSSCRIAGFRITYPITIDDDVDTDLSLEMHVSACMELLLAIPREYTQSGQYHSITIPIDPQERGSATVTLEPEMAREAGAKWRLTHGPDTEWKGSGDYVNDVPVGDYTVEFRETRGWKTPSDETVTIIADACAVKQITYEQQLLRFSPGDFVRTTATTVNLRAEPQINDNVIARVPYHTLSQVKYHPDNGVESDGHHWWYVELHADGRPGWLAETYLDLVTTFTDFAPVHLTPPHRATNVFTNPTFEWREVPGATKYGLYVSKPPYGPENLVFDSEVDHGPITSTEFALPFELEAGVTYYWNMRAGNEDGWGPFSTSWSFTTGSQAYVPVDLVLVLDRSGSMRGARMQGAKDAAISIVNMLMPHDRVAVVSFASTANTNAELTSDFDHAKSEIQRISVGGGTSFGAGMKLAVEELDERGSEDHVPVIIFLSDGHHNVAPAADPWVEECRDLSIPIYTVGLADRPDQVGEAMLEWMAEETGGQYFFVDDLYDLQSVFVAFTLEASGWPLAKEFSGQVGQGETVVAGTFDVEPGTEHVKLTLNWPGSDLDLVVIRPDGSEVELGEDSDNIYSGAWEKPEWVILLAPEPGTWTVKVYGKVVNSRVPFNLWVSNYVDPRREEPDPAIPVGGSAYPVSRLALLAPWIALLAAIAGASLLVLRRRTDHI